MLWWNAYDRTNAESLRRIADSCEGIDASLTDIRFSLSYPGALTFVKLEMTMSQISFKVLLPELLDADVVKRELTVQVGADAPVITELDADATESDAYSGEQDSPVHLSLTDIDDVGNRSEASVLDALLIDTFPPAKPGEMSLLETGETA